jgi:PhnB protein
MLTQTEVKIDKDLANKKITITKHFNAKADVVWDAWTKQEMLDQWWAPKPWRAETSKLEFKEGGSWQYAMLGPNSERSDGKFTYSKINAPKSYEGIDAFTDEKGFVKPEEPQLHWKCEFKTSGAGTDVKITITSKELSDLKRILDMGFEEGFKMGLGNLEEYLEENQ